MDDLTLFEGTDSVSETDRQMYQNLIAALKELDSEPLRERTGRAENKLVETLGSMSVQSETEATQARMKAVEDTAQAESGSGSLKRGPEGSNTALANKRKKRRHNE
jgi:hypothetical protein